MKAYGYLRVSGKSQVDGDGPERQLLAISAFCGNHSLEHGQDFFEEGVSGEADEKDRPALRALLDVAKPGDCIVLERLDRLARLLMFQEFFLGKCADRGLKVYCTDQGLVDVADPAADPSKVFIRQVMGAMAEWEKNALVLKLRKARERTGHFGGERPYGELPGEEEPREMLFNLWKMGMSKRDIAAQLTLSGYRTRRGKPWNKRRVANVLLGKSLRRNRGKTLSPK